METCKLLTGRIQDHVTASAIHADDLAVIHLCDEIAQAQHGRNVECARQDRNVRGHATGAEGDPGQS